MQFPIAPLPRHRPVRLVALAFTLAVGGCASVTTGSRQTLLVQTSNDTGPLEDASCSLTSDKGSWQVQTPGTVSVDLSYQDLHARCSAPGHATAVRSYASTTKPMTFGNVLVGGLIGATVDISSGAAYQYPNVLSIELTRLGDGAVGVGIAAKTTALPATVVRRLQAGDRFDYIVEDRFTGGRRTISTTVAEVDAQRVRFAESGRTEWPISRKPIRRSPALGDLDGLEPPEGWLPVQPHLGAAWSLSYTAADEPPASRLNLEGRILRRERLTTAAGTFDTWAVQYTGTAYRTNGVAAVAQPAELRLWIDTSGRQVVRFESEIRGGMASPPGRLSQERLELIGLWQVAPN